MATTVVVPNLATICGTPVDVAQALITVATATAADISSVEAGATPGMVPVHVVDLATNANLPAGTYSAPNKTYTVTATGTLTVDSVLTTLGMRILVKNATTTTQYGIFKVTTAGAVGVQAVLTRADDWLVSADVQGGMLVGVNRGTVNTATLYEVTTGATFALDTDTPTIGLSSQAFTAGTGCSFSGSTLNVGANADGSIVVNADDVQLGVIATDAQHGGLGVKIANGTAHHGPASRSATGFVSTRNARGVKAANVANLASFTVAANDGITYIAGDLVLLVAQTTAAQNGPYVVGTVGGGTAALTRPADWATGAVIEQGAKINIGTEGTLYGNSGYWKVTAGTGKVVGTDDPVFYPAQCMVTVTLSAGAYTLGSTEGLWLLSTTKSGVHVTRNTSNTSTLTTGGYAAPAANRTAGVVGTAAVLVRAEVAAGTLNNADISTLDVLVKNF